MADLLRSLFEHSSDVLVAGSAWEEDWGLVFCDDVGRPLGEVTALKRFRRILARAGMPRMRFHDLRQTCATLLLTPGVHPKKVQDPLGHSTISVTLDTSSHVFPNLQDEVATAMDGLLSQVRVSGQDRVSDRVSLGVRLAGCV